MRMGQETQDLGPKVGRMQSASSSSRSAASTNASTSSCRSVASTNRPDSASSCSSLPMLRHIDDRSTGKADKLKVEANLSQALGAGQGVNLRAAIKDAVVTRQGKLHDGFEVGDRFDDLIASAILTSEAWEVQQMLTKALVVEEEQKQDIEKLQEAVNKGMLAGVQSLEFTMAKALVAQSKARHVPTCQVHELPGLLQLAINLRSVNSLRVATMWADDLGVDTVESELLAQNAQKILSQIDAREYLKMALQAKHPERLEEALSAAKVCGLENDEDYAQGHKMLVQILARKELHAAVNSKDGRRLAEALKRAKSAGIGTATILQAKAVLQQIRSSEVAMQEKALVEVAGTAAPKDAHAAPAHAATPQRWRRRRQSVLCVPSADKLSIPAFHVERQAPICGA